ncbi:MAG: hypothetical protein KDA87_09120 [Planctomycetales bacterium]|nr:hypothetical protein [Planctomycetales bacterium]
MRLAKSLVLLIVLTGSPLFAQLAVQSTDNVLEDGSAFLWVEGEHATELGGDDPAVGYLVVDNVNPIQSIAETADGTPVPKGGIDILPADTNASGGAALLDQLGGGRHTNTATWEVQFAIPATYYLYVHATIFNSDANTSYSNEDSFFLPPAFNMNSREDWIGFEGVDDQGEPMIGDTDQDGWMPVFNNKQVWDLGFPVTHNNTNEDFWDGTFHWMFADYAIESNADGGYVDDYGIAIKYEVKPEDVGVPMTFEISTREHYSAIDGLLFSTSDALLIEYGQEDMDGFFLNPDTGGLPGDYNADGLLTAVDIDTLSDAVSTGLSDSIYDLNNDGSVNADDRVTWVNELRNTYFGDSNLDGEFGTADLVAVFAAGEYEDAIAGNSGWAEGDWNGDGDFNTSDLVTAFEQGGFELGPRGGVAAVPEPNWFAWVALLTGVAVRRMVRQTRSQR